MTRQPIQTLQATLPKSQITIAGISFLILVLVLMLLSTNGHADSKKSPKHGTVRVEGISSDINEGYGYRPQYIVPAPIYTFWLFKTDFDSDFLLSNDELLDHRFIRKVGNGVI